jgi:hypothetical protein
MAHHTFQKEDVMTMLGTLGLITACAATLAAGTPRYGLLLSGAAPQGDLGTALDNGMGFGAGVFALCELAPGQYLRPRVEAGQYSGKDTWYNPSYKVNATISSVTVGADYLFFPGGTPTGLYLAGGLGYVGTRTETKYVAYGPGGVPQATATGELGSLGLAVGAGWQFTENLGAELRYTSSQFQKFGDKLTAPAVQVSVTWTF